jgi:hypothetical protein
MKFIAIWGISSIVFLIILLVAFCGWTGGFDRWMFHTQFGAFIGCLCCAILATEFLRWLFVRQEPQPRRPSAGFTIILIGWGLLYVATANAWGGVGHWFFNWWPGISAFCLCCALWVMRSVRWFGGMCRQQRRL